jgi:hypothetical protein
MELAARSLWSLPSYRPARAVPRLKAPILVCVAEDDTAASVPLALHTATQTPHSHVRRYPGGHFGAYVGAVFEQMITDEINFLQHELARDKAHPQ